MREHNINTDLKARVLKYLEFTWKLERKHLEKEQMLLEQLPENLKKELLFEANGKALQQFEILKSNFKQEIIDKLSFSLKTTQYSPKEIIYTVEISQNSHNPFIFRKINLKIMNKLFS